MFSDLLVVIPPGKAPQFKADLQKMIVEYYDKMDAQEEKRQDDIAKIRFGEIKESGSEDAQKEFMIKL